MKPTLKTLNTQEYNNLTSELAKMFWKQPRSLKVLRNIAMIDMFLDTGLRLAELQQLSISDLWFRGEPVTILVVKAGIAKNHKERIIPLTATIKVDIKHLHKEIWQRYGVDESRHAFMNLPKYNRLSTRQIQRIVQKITYQFAGRAVTPHTLRHTFATRLMRKTSSRVVQELLGHSNLSSTQIYTHPNGEDLKKAIDGIDGKTVI